MAESAHTKVAASPVNRDTFSLVAGGPLYRLLQRARLSGTDLEMLGRRLAAVFIVAWMPLLILSLIEGHAWGGVGVPFLRDVDAYTRFLVALPLLFAAELVLHRRLRPSFDKFRERELVPQAQSGQYFAVLQSARTWLDSVWVEIFLIVFVYTVGIGGIWRNLAALEMDTWYGTLVNGRLVASSAGWWLGLVSLPLFQFLFLRWYFRLLVWSWLLWRISRLDLNLQPLHPDRAGGLGFLAQLSLAFGPLLMAQGALTAGWIADQIFFNGARLLEFKIEIAAATVIAVCLVLGPLLVFTSGLCRAKRAAVGAYGTLATRYAREFDRKWLDGRMPDGETLIGSGDIQSLADLGSSYANLKEMRAVVFGTTTVMVLAAAFVAPIIPLFLTMISAGELLSKLLKLLF